MQDIVPLVMKQQINAQGEKIEEFGEVSLEDGETTIQERTEKVSDLETKGANGGGDQPGGGLEAVETTHFRGEVIWVGLLLWVLLFLLVGLLVLFGVWGDNLEKGNKEGDIFTQKTDKRRLLLL